jgi:hypothetical protein
MPFIDPYNPAVWCGMPVVILLLLHQKPDFNYTRSNILDESVLKLIRRSTQNEPRRGRRMAVQGPNCLNRRRRQRLLSSHRSELLADYGKRLCIGDYANVCDSLRS